MIGTILLHTKKGNLVVTKQELVDNALKQEKEGIKPSFRRRDTKTLFPKGWCVYSTWEDGCGVVYRRNDGKMILQTGWQGDFICC